MKRIILCLSLFAFFGSQAQQVNPVPDYVFRNQMSVGRNAVTDTAAYISIGPRYGANKGLMPPIVSDTAAITGVKRNGLLIFSVQRNNFQYWDSINSRWTSVTANVDTTVISTRAWRKKGDDSLGAVIATRTDTTLLSTRAWRQKGVDSVANVRVGGSGTTNRVAKFTASGTIGNTAIREVNAQDIVIGSDVSQTGFQRSLQLHSTNTGADVRLIMTDSTTGQSANSGFHVLKGAQQDAFVWNYSNTNLRFATNATERMRLTAAGRLLVGTTTEGTNTVDIAGTLRSTQSANFATTSGVLAVGTTATSGYKFQTVISDANKYNPNSVLSNSANVLINNSSTTDSTGSNLVFQAIGSGASSGISSISGIVQGDGKGLLTFGTRNTNNASAVIERMRIDADGRVGIGTTSPSEVLHVVGRGRFTTIDSTSSPINVLTSDVNGVIRKTAPGVLGSGTTNYLPKFTGTTTIGNSVAFDNGSEILINTTSDAGDYRLQVNGNANFRDDVLIDTNLRVNRHISLDQTPKAWALGNAIEGPQGSTLFVAGGGVQTLANVYYDGSYKYSTSNPGAAMFLLQSGITFATYGSGTANGALTGANEMVYAGGELRVGIADQGTFKLQVADKSYFGDEVQIASTTDLGNYKLQVTGEAIITAGIRTDAPSGGTAATWKLGTVATVSPTSPNRTIEVEIGGTTYYIHAKTTND